MAGERAGDMNPSTIAAWRGRERAGRAFEASTRLPPVIAVAVISLALVTSWAVTYLAGGSRTVLPHLFYLPIILAASRFRWPGAAATAAVAGTLAGPLMPADVVSGAMQPTANWAGRLVVFTVVALLVAWLTTES